MQRTWQVLFGVLLLVGAVQAQTESGPARRPAQIWLDPGLGKLAPIELQDVSIDIRIEGFIASTTLDLTFYNPNARVLEGEFVFPLAEGQSITGYALEVGGKLRQGVVVEKQTARVAFESTARRNVDPGLAELTRGNVFRTRLYPIPAKGSKRVSIAFDQPLLDAGADYRYVLPLQFAQQLRHFKVHAEAVRAEHAPKVAAGDALTFDRTRDGFLADLERSDFQPSRELAFTLEKPAAQVTAFTVADWLEPAWRTFAAQVQSAPPTTATTAAPVRHVALFYDASGSARERDRQRELDFLGAWLAQLRDVDVDLIAFRNDADPALHFHIQNGDSAALRHAIDALPLDGGTSYGAIRLADAPNADTVLIVGDGLSNFGTHEPELTPATGPMPRVILLHAAALVDTTNFARWTRRYGGRSIDLATTSNDAAMRQIGASPWLLQSVRVTAGECVDLAPAAPAPAPATISVYGRCKGPATIELAFGDAGGASLRRSVVLNDAAALEPERGAFVARLWAVARIADLQNAAAPDEAKITELGKRFGVVTANTSMLVLDRVEDYVRYEVEPREPELLAQYRELKARQPKASDQAQSKQQMLAQVLGWWTEFKQWHETRHPWLETVLAPNAELEASRWHGVPADKAGHGRSDAEKLAARAKQLHERWLRDGADENRRAAWEHDATALMLELDKLRLQRLALAPDSDKLQAQPAAQIAQGGGANHTEVTRMRQAAPPRPQPMSVPEPPATVARETAAAPPPADIAPAMPAREAPAPRSTATTDRDGALDTVVVTGSNVRRVDIETSNPVVSVDRAALQQPSAGMAPSVAAKRVAQDATPTPAPTRAHIELKEWDPNTPYLATLRASKDPYAAYLQARAHFANSPAFILDCADYLRDGAHEPRLALRVLSNLAEIDVESAPLLRILAYRLEQWQRYDLAVPLFETALKLRGEEPQSYRDLALALLRQTQPDFVRAGNLLWRVVDSNWDGRFPEIQTIALHELNDLLARAPAAQRIELRSTFDRDGADARLFDAVPVDLRVVLTWDADDTDIDLWVIDPTGEIAIYNQPRTKTGGRMSRDFTGGYGPEVFTIRRAIPGTYTVKANYYGSRQQKVAGDVTVQLEFFTHFDSGEDKREAVTRRLANRQDLIEVGRFVVGGK